MALKESVYCNLKTFSKSFESIHGGLSLSVCFFGSIANVLNICVLTTKEMRGPTNLVLTGLAIADLLVMLDYIPFAFHRYINIEERKSIEDYSYRWAVFMLFHAFFSQVFHFIACCLTVILAIWRYLAITNPQSLRFWCEIRKTFYVIFLTYFLCPLVCSPIFISLKISSYNQTCDENSRILEEEDLPTFNGTVNNETVYITEFINDTYKQVSFWLYSAVLKLVPCILLTHLSRKLIVVLLETKKRRKLLLNPGVPLQPLEQRKFIHNRKIDRDRQADRTTAMLVAVLLLFLITEFPQAILGLLSVAKGSQFASECYEPLGK